MRQLLLLSLLFCSILSFAQKKNRETSFIRSLPVPHRAVNDFGKLLTTSEKQRLEKKLTAYQKRVTNAIAIVVITLDSLTDPKTKKQYTVEETALLYFNTWGIGDHTMNNGVLLLVSRNPRRVRIEVGKGLQAILTDDVCQQIVDDSLVPNFKKGLYFAGLKGAVAAIVQKVDSPHDLYQKSSPPQQTSTPQQSQSYSENGFQALTPSGMVGGFFIVGLLMFFTILIIGIARAGGRKNSGCYSRSGYNDSYSRYPVNENSNKFFFFNHTHSGRSSGDHSSSFSSGGSSSSWSSDSSPSSSSSGSFDGGSSSGGGASGSW
jgi:uncharacterized protein